MSACVRLVIVLLGERRSPAECGHSAFAEGRSYVAGRTRGCEREGPYGRAGGRRCSAGMHGPARCSVASALWSSGFRVWRELRGTGPCVLAVVVALGRRGHSGSRGAAGRGRQEDRRASGGDATDDESAQKGRGNGRLPQWLYAPGDDPCPRPTNSPVVVRVPRQR